MTLMIMMIMKSLFLKRSAASLRERLKSMVATELVPIMLRRGSEVIWFNKMVNSPFGICQLRLSYEKETDGNTIHFNFCCCCDGVIQWYTLCV